MDFGFAPYGEYVGTVITTAAIAVVATACAVGLVCRGRAANAYRRGVKHGKANAAAYPPHVQGLFGRVRAGRAGRYRGYVYTRGAPDKPILQTTDPRGYDGKDMPRITMQVVCPGIDIIEDD